MKNNHRHIHPTDEHMICLIHFYNGKRMWTHSIYHDIKGPQITEYQNILKDNMRVKYCECIDELLFAVIVLVLCYISYIFDYITIIDQFNIQLHRNLHLRLYLNLYSGPYIIIYHVSNSTHPCRLLLVEDDWDYIVRLLIDNQLLHCKWYESKVYLLCQYVDELEGM